MTKDGGTVYTKTVKRAVWQISSRYALVVRQVFDYRGNLTETLVEVRGQGLRDGRSFGISNTGIRSLTSMTILKDILEGADNLRLNEKRPRAKEAKNDDLVFEMEAALQVIKEDFTKEEENLQSLMASDRITCDKLSAIVRPDELVYKVDALGQPCVYRAARTSVYQKSDGTIVFCINGRQVDSNGQTTGWTSSEALEVPSFVGEKPIVDLKAYPLRFHPENDQVRGTLIKRGLRRMQLHEQRFYDYSGAALHETKSPLGIMSKEKFNARGLFHWTPFLFPTAFACPPSCTASASPPRFGVTSPITPFLPCVLTHSGAFSIPNTTSITWNPTIWDLLVLPTPSKRLLRTLVKSQVPQRPAKFDYFVLSNGLGLVCLLSGPPGVGKTLTAEAVAETVQRPLYVLSSGKLGSDPDIIDERLEGVFRLAQTWKAVLLLDEAEVFMAKRSATDLARNAVVSIFLSQLDYYRGILILTMNRVEEIDEAFRSRIHFQLCYKDLDMEAKKAIWRGFLKKVGGEGASVDVEGEEMEKLAGMEMNGRQVRFCVGLGL
ncbi:P-loop containing nucleoside triphosphate hydrolase protein [Immersiella caudata]|uniref:P-loop containing nucleoside triphosphate hydrolase protein n=1 Tax=Immersiella caudata TaxID=314043 RepID=A0AA40C3W9_9PEZI|nr:P-loop containing nucleoside triphosphate hydrolase protein [Immersiella caudata]